jgi:hypothetical protein
VPSQTILEKKVQMLVALAGVYSLLWKYGLFYAGCQGE